MSGLLLLGLAGVLRGIAGVLAERFECFGMGSGASGEELEVRAGFCQK